MFAARVSAIDEVRGGRTIHTKATPLLGGVGIGAAIIVGILIGVWLHVLPSDGPLFLRLMGFILAILVLLFGGMLDDCYRLPPSLQILFPICAALLVVATGTSILEISSLHGPGIWRLDGWRESWQVLGRTFSLVLPADMLTLSWLLAVTYATKTMDGIDSLVTGHTMVGAGLILLLASSPLFFQPTIVILAWIIFGAFAGFLPSNIHPARQFLGESGSTLAGFALGFLAIVSGAKVATAFMVLGIPLVDFLLVVFLRLRARRSPFEGDGSHLHFRFLRLGFSQQQIAGLFWMTSLLFGFIALGLQTRGKTILMTGLICLTLFASFGASTQKTLSHRWKKRLCAILCVLTCVIGLWSMTGLWRAHAQETTLKEISIHGHRLWIELADTPAKQTQGLSDRSSLEPNHGMLFTFPEKAPYTFWMPRMYVDLDIIWLDGDRIVDMVRLPAPKGDEAIARYTPRAPGDQVLEILAGQAEGYGLHVGDHVPELVRGAINRAYP